MISAFLLGVALTLAVCSILAWQAHKAYKRIVDVYVERIKQSDDRAIEALKPPEPKRSRGTPIYKRPRA